MKAGDFARHPHLGTVRLVDVQPETVVVRQKNGTSTPLKAFEAQRDLVLVPSDGFWVLLYEKEFNCRLLQENVEEFVIRLMRDRHRDQVSLEEIRREFSPILERDKKSWKSWWKVARPKLLASGRVVADPKKKTLLVLRSKGLSAPQAGYWISEIRRASDSGMLLRIARELRSAGDSEAGGAAYELAQAVLSRLAALSPQDSGFAELLCAACCIRATLTLEGKHKGASRTIRMPYFTQVGLKPPPPFDHTKLNLPEYYPAEN